MPRWGGPSAPAPRHGTEAAARSTHSRARTQHRTPPRPWSSVSPHAHPQCLQAALSSTLGQRSSRALVKQLHVNDISLPALLSSAQWLGEAAWPRFHTQVLLLAICTCRQVIAHEYGSRSYRSDPVWVQMDPEGPA